MVGQAMPGLRSGIGGPARIGTFMYRLPVSKW